MILAVSVTFLLGTFVTAEPPITTPVVQNVVSSQKPSEYFPLFLSGIPNNIVKPQLLHLSAHLPTQLQYLFDAIEKDNCKKSLPIVSPFVVNEFIRKAVNFEENLKVQNAHFARIPHYSVNDKTIVIADSPKLPELSAKDLEVLRKKLSEDVIEIEQPKTAVIVPPVPKQPPIEMPHIPAEKVVKDSRLTLQLIKENKPIAIPEPPTLPQLSVKELGPLKEQVPKYEIEKEEQKKHLVIENKPVIVSEPLLRKHIESSIELAKFPIVDKELPSAEPRVTTFQPKIPEPPILPNLSIEQLRQLKNQVPEYVNSQEKSEKHVIAENMLVTFPELPILPELTLIKVPEFVIGREQLKSHLITGVFPPAPQLPKTKLSELPSAVDKLQIIHQLPSESPSHLKLGVSLNAHPILMSNSNLDRNKYDDSISEKMSENRFFPPHLYGMALEILENAINSSNNNN